MSLFQFNVSSLFVGGAAPLSAAFESIATQTLQGVQQAGFAIVYPREDTAGWDGAGDQEVITRPRATLDLGWIYASGANEAAMGFITSPSGTIPALSALNEERNYYVLANQNGHDSIGYTDPECRVLGLGMGVLTRYEFSAAVGQPTTVSASVEGLNLLIQPSGSGQPLPSVHKQAGTAVTGLYTLPTAGQTITSYFEAAPAAIQLTFNTGSAIGVALSGQNACPIESFTFSIDIPRTDMVDLGWAYPNQRPIQWPITVGINAAAKVNGFQLDALNRLNCQSGHSFTVGFKNGCETTGDWTFQFDGAKLDSQSLAVAVGGGVATVSLNWSLKIHDINRRWPNFYIHATGRPYDSIVFPQVDHVSGSAPLTFDLSSMCFLAIVSGPGILSGNSVFVADEAGTVVVRAAATNGSDTQDLTVTVG